MAAKPVQMICNWINVSLEIGLDMCEKNFEMYVCLWPCLIVLRWPCVAYRTLKSTNFQTWSSELYQFLPFSAHLTQQKMFHLCFIVSLYKHNCWCVHVRASRSVTSTEINNTLLYIFNSLSGHVCRGSVSLQSPAQSLLNITSRWLS